VYISVGLADVKILKKACDCIKSLIEKHRVLTDQKYLYGMVSFTAYRFQQRVHDGKTIGSKSVAYARKFARQVEDLLSVAENAWRTP
jgi:ribosomal protein L22